MEAADTATIKQARLLNGSKILCTYSSQRQEQADHDSVIQVLKTIETNGTVIETKLDTLIKRRKELLKGHGDMFQREDEATMFKKLKLESKKIGEECMQLFERLDQLECGDQAHRTHRKQVATQLNSILDKNDKLCAKLSSK